MNEITCIAVFGSSRPQPGSPAWEEARAVGYALGNAGWTVVTGGYRGVMEAASMGAKAAGDATIGVTTAFFGKRGLAANRWVDTEVKTATYAERLLRLTGMADGYVIMKGGSGTLAELFLTWELAKNGSIPPRPIVLHGGHWRRVIDALAEELGDELSFSAYRHLLNYSSDPDETVRIIESGLTAR